MSGNSGHRQTVSRQTNRVKITDYFKKKTSEAIFDETMDKLLDVTDADDPPENTMVDLNITG